MSHRRSSGCRPIPSCRRNSPPSRRASGFGAPPWRWKNSRPRSSRYLGEERTQSAFEAFAAAERVSLDPKEEADFRLVRHAEHILASAIGAASSRLVLSLLLRKRTVSTKAALKLLDDANAAIQYNREILQTALDHVRQGIAVFDKELQLICWNRQFGEILDLPPGLIRVGVGLADILRFNSSRRGDLSADRAEEFVTAQIERYISGNEPFLERFAEGVRHRGALKPYA